MTKEEIENVLICSQLKYVQLRLENVLKLLEGLEEKQLLEMFKVKYEDSIKKIIKILS